MGQLKRICVVAIAMAAALPLMAGISTAEPQPSEEQVQQLDDLTIKEKGGAPGVETRPTETVIDVEEFTTIAAPNSIIDVLKTQAIIDFRGDSDFDPGVDSIYMRGFDSTRFVTAIDNVTLQKTGGRKSSNIVDYATLPAFLIEKVEILPGPHSALFDSKSIGGVLNFVTRRPERYESAKPDVSVSTNYGSYDSWNGNASVRGSVSAFTYDLGYQKYQTDGYLRNSASETNTLFGRLGLLLPHNGFIAFTASYADVNRNTPVNNPGEAFRDDENKTDYDASYPTTANGAFEPYESPTWDSIARRFRLDYEQKLPIGRLQASAYQGYDNRVRAYYTDASKTEQSVMDTEWWAQGGKIQDEIEWAANHVTTVGVDLAQLFDDGIDDFKGERINKKGAYLQHQWGIVPSLDLRLGLRYEDVRIWVTNSGTRAIPDREEIIERHWAEPVPKSFLSWHMDGMAAWLRDTDLSAGVSKIWRAPDYHGDYNPQGRPAGAWLEPEHGIGYDLILDRRLWRDIALQLDYSFYDIEDYIATNSKYAEYTNVNSSLRYSDYKINLDRVYRHGVDVGIGGHLFDPLSFYLTYSWQKFDNQGNEKAGDTELDKRAEHRVTAGLRYALFENTTLMLDYSYQSREITDNWETKMEDADGDGEVEEVYEYSQDENAPYNVFDLGVQYKLFNQLGALRQGLLKVWVKNLLDEDYDNSSGYPATDRNYGVGLKFDI